MRFVVAALLLALCFLAGMGLAGPRLDPGVDEPFDPNAMGPKWLPGYSSPPWDFEDGATFDLWSQSGRTGDASAPHLLRRRIPALLGQDQFWTYVGWLPARSVFSDTMGTLYMVLVADPPWDEPGTIGAVDLASGRLVWRDARELVRPAVGSGLSVSVYGP